MKSGDYFSEITLTVTPLQPFYPLRVSDDQDGCWLQAGQRQRKLVMSVMEAQLLIKSATMLSCWDLTWCPSYLQITLHIVQHFNPSLRVGGAQFILDKVIL